MCEFRPREQVLRSRKGRNPAAILLARVPADVVGVEMRTENEIDLFRRNPDFGQPLEVRCLLAVPLREGGTFLIVPDTGIYQDCMILRPEDEAVKTHLQELRLRIDEARQEPIAIGLELLEIEVREQDEQRIRRSLGLDYPIDAQGTSKDRLHGRGDCTTEVV